MSMASDPHLVHEHPHYHLVSVPSEAVLGGWLHSGRSLADDGP